MGRFCLATIASLVLLFGGACLAKAEGKSEKEYTSDWCHSRGGFTEHRLADRTRVDCMLNGYAIEFDFARKWAEAPVQALHYARYTGRVAAVALILEKEYDCVHLKKLHSLVYHDKIGVVIFEVGPFAHRCI